MDAAARATKRVQRYHDRRSVRRADDASAHPQDSHDVRRAARLHVRNLNRDDVGTRVRHRHGGRHSLQRHSRKPLTRAHRRDRRGCCEGDHREGNPYGRRAEGACARIPLHGRGCDWYASGVPWHQAIKALPSTSTAREFAMQLQQRRSESPK